MIDFASLKNPSPKQLRSFSLITFLGFLLIAILGWRKQSATLVFTMVALLTLLLAAQAYRPLLLTLYRSWMALSQILGWFTSRIILTIIFYGLFTPIGLLLRMINKPLLDLRFPDKRSSFWQKRDNHRSNLKKMF